FEAALARLNARQPDALRDLRRLAAANPDAAVFQTTYARALKEAGQVKTALDVYRQAAKRWPTDGALLHDLAVAARDLARTGGVDRRGLHAEAARAERAALTVVPDSPAARNGLGLLAIDEQKPSEAAREFEHATALDPTNA